MISVSSLPHYLQHCPVLKVFLINCFVVFDNCFTLVQQFFIYFTTLCWFFMLSHAGFVVKPLPQSVQLNGCSPVGIMACSCRLRFRVNFLPQREQPNGFSPAWSLICLCRDLFWLNFLPHSGQPYVFGPAVQWHVSTVILTSLCFTKVEAAWASLVLFHLSLLQSISQSEETGSKCPAELAEVSPPPSRSVCLSWRCREWRLSPSPSYFTDTAVGGNSVIWASFSPWSCSPSRLLQSSSCSSLMGGGSGSTWPRLVL